MRDAGPGETLVSLRGATVVRGRTVLDKVDVEIRRGEIVTLIGPNGAGKSTLVKVILGIERLDAGALERKPDLRVGYQPQRFALDPTLPLSVRRLLTLNAGPAPQRSDEIVALFQLGPILDDSVHTLSGGELQRVMLARAVLRQPDLLVLDEPDQNLDVAAAAEIYRIVARIRDGAHCAVLLVSHDLNIVMAATDRVYCLNGHVCCSGRPQDVSRSQAFIDLFGSANAAALAVYPHHHDHEHGLGAHPHHHHGGHRA